MNKYPKSILATLFWSSRPISWINTAYPFAAAYLVTAGRIDPVFIVGTLFFLIPYNLLMYGVNDVFDYESDIRNPRKGGIEGAVLPKTMHRPILFTAFGLSLPFVIYLLFSGNVAANVTLLVVLFFVLAYSLPQLRFKERPFLDSLTSSLHFVGPALYALSLTEFSPTAWLILAAFLLWGMASHAFGAVQDVRADREGHISSVATIIGARWTVRFAFTLYLATAIIIASLASASAYVVALALSLYALNVAPFLSIDDEHCEQANAGWRRFIYVNLAVGFVITLVLIETNLFN